MDLHNERRRFLEVMTRVEALPPAELFPLAAEVSRMSRELQSRAEAMLSGLPEANVVGSAVQLFRSAIASGMAAKALATFEPKALAVNARLARRHLSDAWAALTRVSQPFPEPKQESETSGHVGVHRDVSVSTEPREVLQNLARYHRAHERYYARQLCEAARALCEESTRLRLVAESWLRGAGKLTDTSVDHTDSRYRAVGCEDLNVLEAIPSIGVLFMEGEGEPAELRTLKSRLSGTAQGAIHAGRWLAEKADVAWVREQSLFHSAWAEAAEARFDTIAANWCGSREMELAGRLITQALAHLEQVDFRPKAIRANRENSAHVLFEAVWILDTAAEIHTRFAARLAEGDRNWTEYLRVLEAAA